MPEITPAEIEAARASCCSADSCLCCRDALKYIAAVERLQAELARVTAERDAAWNAAIEAAAKIMEEMFDSGAEQPSVYVRALARPEKP